MADGGQRLDGRFSEDGDEDIAAGEGLPGYKADISAPVYLEEWRQQAVNEGAIDDEIDAETQEAIRQSRPLAEGEERQGTARDSNAGEPVLSVLDYERRIRGEAPQQADEAVLETAVPSAEIVDRAFYPAVPVPHATVRALRRPESVRVPFTGPPEYDNPPAGPDTANPTHLAQIGSA